MLPVRGATHERLQREISETISIHAPRAGSDQGKRGVNHKIDKFQSMLPVRGATLAAGFGGLLMSISIHAPRAGSDRPPHQQPPSVLYFNPCSPCGERLWADVRKAIPDAFQSMLPVRGATYALKPLHLMATISIHAPRAGSDKATGLETVVATGFQSMLPVRGATHP